MIGPDSAHGSTRWGDWMGRPAAEVYARLREKDSLGIDDACLACIREQGFLLYLPEAYEEALLEVAFECELGSAEDAVAGWIERSVLRALERVLERQREDERSGKPANGASHRFLIELFGLPPERGRHASVRFHALPKRSRRAFRALVIEDRPLEEVERMGLGDRAELLRSILTIYEAVGATMKPEYLPMTLEGEG